MNLDPLDVAAQRKLRARLASPPKAKVLDVLGQDHNHTRIQTLARMFAVRFGPGKLSPGEYAKYGTGDVSLDELKRFAGVRVQKALHAACNDQTWFAITKHKLLFEKLMKGAGLPTAETLAVFDPKGRSLGFPLLHTRDEFAAFLASEENLPCFCKPVTGTYSLGCFVLERSNGKKFLINGHRSATAQKILDFMEGFSAKGYLFQRPLEPDPSLVKRAAPVVAGVRTQSWDVAMTKKGPVLLEVNFGGDLSLIQLGLGKGIFTPEYCGHLKRNGYRGRLP